MQIVHSVNAVLNETDNTNEGFKNSGIKYGIIGLLFSVEEFDRDISIANNESVHLFFEHLKFDDLNEPIVDRVSFGGLMAFLDFNARWVYHGSMTTPPCAPHVYWNVLNKILPIKITEFARIKKMM